MAKESNTINFIRSLHTPAVRHLAGAVFSEPLLHMLSRGPSGGGLAETPCLEKKEHHQVHPFPLDDKQRNWLHEIDKQPQTLLQFIAARGNHKLGLYHEQLWQYFLHCNDSTQLLASNLAVRDKQRSLGEFDILYQHSELGTVHLELASKYYLVDPPAPDNSTEWRGWLGPGGRDRLDLKLEHCLKKQIALADHPVAQQTLQDKLGLTTATHSLSKQLHIGGRLFYPFANSTTLLDAPRQLNPLHQRGCWLRLQQWQQLCREQAFDRHPLQKLDWLDSGADRPQNNDKEKVFRTDQSIAPPQLFLCHGEPFGQRPQYCLVVTDEWPAET